MKKLALLPLLAAFVACNNLPENTYLIEGKADPSWEGRKIVLEKPGGNVTIPVDTAVVKDGFFSFSDTISKPQFYLLSVQGIDRQKADLILEPGKIEVIMDKDTLPKSVVKGTYNNDKYTEYKSMNMQAFNKFQAFNKENKFALTIAEQKGDTVTVNKLTKERKQILKEFDQKLVDFIKANPKAYANINALRYVYEFKFRTDDEVMALFESFDPSIKETPQGKQIAAFFEKLKNKKSPLEDEQAPQESAAVKVGMTAPAFSAPTPEGKTLSLKEAMGKVTLIDFWASWCIPCRKENPHVVALYKQYHAKGLNIIGVSLDKDADSWKRAIEKDGLNWYQVSNLKYWEDPIAAEYGIKAIPAPILIDAQGKIVAIGLTGEALEAKIKELL